MGEKSDSVFSLGTDIDGIAPKIISKVPASPALLTVMFRTVAREEQIQWNQFVIQFGEQSGSPFHRQSYYSGRPIRAQSAVLPRQSRYRTIAFAYGTLLSAFPHHSSAQGFQWLQWHSGVPCSAFATRSTVPGLTCNGDFSSRSVHTSIKVQHHLALFAFGGVGPGLNVRCIP